MHPAYKWGGSYPYHASNAMHFAPNDDPRAKEISSHMKMHPNTLSSPYQPWLYGGNYCYHGPQECHGGYNHGGPYSFRPPYSYYPPPPPPPFHTHGFYHPFPGAYPAYSFPPPHYSVEQPRYDYDKNTHGFHHCCGCNHREDEKKSKIEREEPEIEKKTSDSLAPFLIKDCPYPIMWVPPGFMNTESKTKEKEKHSHDHVPLEHLEPSKQGGNGETKQDQRGGDDGNSLPFPICWFPSKNNEVGEKNVDLVANKASRESEVESEMGSKPAVQKVIPVKQLGTEEEKKSLKSIETKLKSGSVEKTDNGMEGKASPKTSKLPPVCLRIDPLPRKKNSSRSPSPPGDKGRSKGSLKDDSKSSEQQTQLSEGLKKSKEERSEGNIKTIKVVEKDSLADPCEIVPRGAGSLADPRENVTRGAGSLADLCENVPKGAGTLADPCEKVPRGAGSLVDPCDNVPMGAGNGSEKGIVCKAEKKKFSENEAALIIQSACRGFQVRKSKPITKLRQIAEVGKQVIELRDRIHDLESSSSGIGFDNKQKLVIGETIMSLLLKLDTIQGLHPVVREVRKRVAKELVGLQEKLDSLTSQTPIDDDDATKRVKDAVAIQEKSETQIEDSIKREDDDIQETSETQIEDGIKIKENSEIQLDGNNVKLVESAMIHEDDDGAESHNINLEPQMELQNEESNKGRELNNKQLQVEAETNQPLDSAESHNTNLEPSTELLNEESYTGREVNNKQLLEDDDDVIQDKIVAESDRNGDIEVDDMIAKGAESGTNTETVDDMIAKSAESGTSIETAAGCDMNVEPQNIEEVITKNEFGRDVEEKAEQDSVDVTEDNKDVVVMDQLVKEQMDVIMELRARVKDLENKLLKNNNNKKIKKVNKKKKNKGRRSRGCVVEEELN